MTLPIVEHYHQLKDESVSLFVNHRKLILISLVITVSLALFGVWAMRVRSAMLARINVPHKEASAEAYVALTLPTSSPSAYIDILGTSDDTSLTELDTITFPIPTPYTIITQIPLPTYTPVQITTTTTTSSSGCAGTPTVDNSQVYVSTKTAPVGSTVSIEVDLQDCTNMVAPVTDTLKITLLTGDSSTKINGSTLPVHIDTKNGKVTFSVTAGAATTATFLITDTVRNFTVTTPGYHNPTVTFTNGSTGSTGNANCTTSAGAPNSWYSDVYPNPPITTTTGSVALQVVIRDCFKNTTSVSDNLTISLSSGDPGTKINGNSLPYSVSAQNGVANFTLTSQVNGTVTLVVTNTTSGFVITDPNNHNPSITFSGSTTSSPTNTPTPTPATTATPTPVPTPTPTGTASSSATPTDP